ncbi:MAG: RsmB/NOP family class I SAM-dependent RNA methyltransferase [Pseudomonadota bacterium]
MRLGGRVQAAVEVLTDIDTRQRPASEALKDWGVSHRFAGSGDRSAIGNLVYDVLRRKKSLNFLADNEDNLARVYALLFRSWKLDAEETRTMFAEDKFAPEFPNDEQLKQILSSKLSTAEPDVQGDIPEWCVPSFEANFADNWLEEAQAFADRPSLDLRVNTLKAERAKILKQIAKTGAKPSAIARNGMRISSDKPFARLPNVKAEEGYQKGRFEVQDEGSQIVADLIFAQPGEMVLDFCAGAGGKSLAMAAAMENKGQIHAYDIDKHRLAPIHERLRRAGTRNVQVHEPDADLSDLVGKMDKVVVDAPCTGSGTWRRRPDAKWRLDTKNLEERLRQQEEVLSEAAPFIRPGGHMIYITCSVFPEENENQVYAFTEDNPEFELVSAGEAWEELFGYDKPAPWSSDMKSITLTPASTNTDGFFFAVLERSRV